MTFDNRIASEDHKIYCYAAWVIFATILILIFWTFLDYGITWDEELQSQYGLAVADYYDSGFKDMRYAEIFNLYLYGGMFDGLAAIVDHYTPFHISDNLDVPVGHAAELQIDGDKIRARITFAPNGIHRKPTKCAALSKTELYLAFRSIST